MGEMKNGFILIERPQRSRPLGMPRRRWKDNVKMNLREIGCEGVDWTELALDKV
jgi:hypothetical protein